jgi:hypothetical protein
MWVSWIQRVYSPHHVHHELRRHQQIAHRLPRVGGGAEEINVTDERTALQ